MRAAVLTGVRAAFRVAGRDRHGRRGRGGSGGGGPRPYRCADYAFEALGREETVQQAWASLDVRGQLVLVGLLPGGARITLDAGPFVSEQSVKGCYFGSADISGRRTCTATSRFWSAIICVASWRWMS